MSAYTTTLRVLLHLIHVLSSYTIVLAPIAAILMADYWVALV